MVSVIIGKMMGKWGYMAAVVTDDTNDVFRFARVDDNERIIFLLNASDKAAHETVSAADG